MKSFYRKIVNNPKKIIFVFLLLAVLGAVLRNFVGVDYDMLDYLPKSTPSTISLDLMREEFGGGIPNARVMVENVTVPEALEYKEEIKNCAGVSAVTWLDDAENILQPLEVMDADTVESYYINESALFSVTIEEGMEVEAVSAIREVIGDENHMSGNAVSMAIATTGTVDEISLITVISIIFIIIVLIITTSSWAEPILIMIGLGVAVLINAGSNIIFGEISFVTNAAGSILQIAVSLDYSIFLIHRFEECQRSISDPKEAMIEALSGSAGSILSSGLTTVIGFLALVFMQFRLGPDLGTALAKGIAVSLVTVFVFMPPLVLLTHKWLKKTEHRLFLPSFKKFGRFVFRVMVPMVVIFIILIAPSYLGSNSNDFYYGSSHIYGTDTQVGSDSAAIEETFGKLDTYVAMVKTGDSATELALSKALHNIAQVKSIISYVDTVGAEIPMEYLDKDVLAQLVSDNYSRFVLTLDAEYEGKETFDLVENIRATLNNYYPDSYYLAGSGVSAYDLMDTITSDTVIVNLIAAGAVFIVLLFAFRSILLPAILVFAIETAIWINLSIPYFTGAVVFYVSYLIISSIQLGATVDYAILFTNRYLEFRRQNLRRDAVIETVSKVTPSIITSGSVLIVVGFLLYLFSSHAILAQLGWFLGFGGILSLSIVLFVLPGLLYLLDKPIRRATLGLKLYDESKTKRS